MLQNDGMYCSQCPDPMIPLNLDKPQSILAHNAAHIANGRMQKTLLPCGLCLSPAPQCQFYLTGTGDKTQIDRKRTHGCQVFNSLTTRGFKYAVAAKSTASSPCSNVPIPCRICSRSDQGLNKKAPAIWKYTAREHYKTKHKNVDLKLYEDDWRLSRLEMLEMKKVYKKRKEKTTLPKKRAQEKASKMFGELVVSELHQSNR